MIETEVAASLIKFAFLAGILIGIIGVFVAGLLGKALATVIILGIEIYNSRRKTGDRSQT